MSVWLLLILLWRTASTVPQTESTIAPATTMVPSCFEMLQGSLGMSQYPPSPYTVEILGGVMDYLAEQDILGEKVQLFFKYPLSTSHVNSGLYQQTARP